jgi:urease accessory protein
MRASAHLSIARVHSPDGRGRSRVTRLRSDSPIVLRPTIATGADPLPRWNLAGTGTARVAWTAGAAGPLGGDDLRLSVEVGVGAALVLRDVSATLVLPGPHAQRSHSRTTIRVGADATLVWLPEPLIAARGCDHRVTTTVLLEPGARLLLREELLLGRHGESPGAVRQRLRVCVGGRPLHDQELGVGPDFPGWDGPATTGGRRALGSLLVVDPYWLAEPQTRPVTRAEANVALLPLSDSAVLVTALADDALELRRRLDTGLSHLSQ